MSAYDLHTFDDESETEPSPLGASRIALRVAVADPAAVDLDAFVPSFHSALASGALAGELLVDVASYAHVRGGPGLLLVGAHAHYGLTDGPRATLSRTQRRPWARRPIERLGASLVSTLAFGAHLGERHPGFAVRPDEIEVVILDRLVAPNTKRTFARVAPALSSFFAEVYAGGVDTSPSSTDREPFAVRIRAHRAPSVAELLERLAPFAQRPEDQTAS